MLNFREQHRSWPTSVLIPESLLVSLEKELEPEDLSAIRRKVRIVAPPEAERALAYDDAWRFAEGLDGAPRDTAQVERWLGLKRK